ncbi:DUF2126 domain-containing protein [Parvibium lacunae]|uniref:IMP dehydrogenase n=1 Tax=Parvibium lacunae TaxID=1888893 RepID=A0A368L7T9_9BURK|nr:transglutaminase family protein [Parvibium lacunae]RCS59622.1 IMP dehydrogenase [Parvibium lacunae]
MTIRVALTHTTHYQYDRLVTLSPHEVRLRPAPHARTPLLSYSLAVTPDQHFINWQQDPFSNWVGRFVFTERTQSLSFTVNLVADMTVINPFDFFIESYAEHYPFRYPQLLAKELAPYLEIGKPGRRLQAWLSKFKQAQLEKRPAIVDMLVNLNATLYRDIRYLVRLEPGVQTPEQTLGLACGSCRDSAWLLVHILRHLGLAARFVSGYLIQLKADVTPIEGPSGPEKDFTDLHAWCEVYIPGAGWVGLDPTSGLLAGEGHIPLAATPSPQSAAPIIGASDIAQVDFSFAMQVTRLHEDPRVTQPFTEQQWQAIDQLGMQVDEVLKKQDVRLTQGGEPTFVSIDDMNGPEWNFTALSPTKYALGSQLTQRLAAHYAQGYLLHSGQGKWYPGEPLPRWAMNVFWRADGQPLWHRPQLFANTAQSGQHTAEDAAQFMQTLLSHLGLPVEAVLTAYEDIPELLIQESRLPKNLDPLKHDLSKKTGRASLARALQRGLKTPVGLVLPLRAKPDAASISTTKRRRRSAEPEISSPTIWQTSRWPLRRERLYLLAGDSPLGLRLPLDALPWQPPEDDPVNYPRDPFAACNALPTAVAPGKRRAPPVAMGEWVQDTVIKTALCVEVRRGHLHVFMPPLTQLEEYVALLTAIEHSVAKLNLQIVIEGYAPPRDPRLLHFAVTPDPGVIEVNIMPAPSWAALVKQTASLYDLARQTRLGTDKFMLDGRHTGTGGGNHVTLGGPTPADSPLLRRPDLLRSLISYWQNHPALSYLFSGTFIGPTSQAPRVDEARDDRLYELEIAFQQLARTVESGKEHTQPWLVDRLFRHLLTDLTGNTHRAEFCIDKLYSPDSATGRLGLLEFRGFEMPPHWQMSTLQHLLLRALVAWFWQQPYQKPLIPWGTSLHDRFMLPHFIMQDFAQVLTDLKHAGYAFEQEWFAAFYEFRFPRYGAVSYDGVTLALRQAIEPWHVLGEEISAGGTARYVDSSVERLELKVTGMLDARHAVLCNGKRVPLMATGRPGEYVAGIRYRAWAPPSALHPTIGVQTPLMFDLVDQWNEHSLGGCAYHVSHPGGRNYDTFPINANEAEARRHARFVPFGHTPGQLTVPPIEVNPAYPCTLDLRWKAS